MKMSVTEADAGPNDEPRISACMFHRCLEHMNVPGLNDTESSGAECGACEAEKLWHVHAQLMGVLDAFGARLITSSIYKSHIQKCIDRLNFLEEGAGDRMLQEIAEDYQKHIIRRREIEARVAAVARNPEAGS